MSTGPTRRDTDVFRAPRRETFRPSADVVKHAQKPTSDNRPAQGRAVAQKFMRPHDSMNQRRRRATRPVRPSIARADGAGIIPIVTFALVLDICSVYVPKSALSNPETTT